MVVSIGFGAHNEEKLNVTSKVTTAETIATDLLVLNKALLAIVFIRCWKRSLPSLEPKLAANLGPELEPNFESSHSNLVVQSLLSLRPI